MQAINLMIGDAGRLIFILGMDREKVAAGIAQKYKDLLPFIPEFAASASGSESNLGALYFGYSYLEKFIQLSFTLPIISNPELLIHFLKNVNNKSTPSSNIERLVEFWLTKAKSTLKRNPQLTGATGHDIQNGVIETASSSGMNSTAQETRVEYLRIKVGQDSDQIRNIASIVGPVFENNPRRLKQFINTFRLALFVSSSQGIFDLEEGTVPVTPEQLGKFIAITLRFPNLRSFLADDPDLLRALETMALNTEIPSDHPFNKWLGQRGVRNLLTYGLISEDNPLDKRFSLEKFPIQKMLSILPNIPERASGTNQTPTGQEQASTLINGLTPTKYGELTSAFDQLGLRYEEIRENQTAGPKRTQKLTRIFEDAKQRASELNSKSAQIVFSILVGTDREGARLIGLAIAAVHPDQTNVPWLLKVLDKYRSWFEHYQCIRTLLGYEHFVSAQDCKLIIEILNRHWEDIEKDTGRVGSADTLRIYAKRWQERMPSPPAA